MSKYSKEIVDRICALVETDNYTIPEICKYVGIVPSTYHKWLNEKEDFSDAIKKAKDNFDEIMKCEAKRSLRKLIQGYEVDEVKTVYSENKEGKPRIKERTVTKKHYQPNTVAVIFALKNLDPDNWRDKQEVKMEGEIGIVWEENKTYEAQ